ncbi:MAG TPA: hypothetical protein VEM57_06350, partial [Candidatus Binatus sp.]|nr:hypothetical protein [Candidatus Binatus sp.]
MSACLTDQELWVLTEGAGETAERDHLERCALCSYRSRQLEDDLALVGGALRGACPPGVSAGVRPKMVRLTWGAAVALVVFGLVALWSAPPWRPSTAPLARTDGVAALTELSASVFGEDTPEISRATDLDVVATA